MGFDDARHDRTRLRGGNSVEIAASLEPGRHGAHDRERPFVVPALERREGEDLVLPDRAAERRAEHPELTASQRFRILAGRDKNRRIANRVQQMSEFLS